MASGTIGDRQRRVAGGVDDEAIIGSAARGRRRRINVILQVEQRNAPTKQPARDRDFIIGNTGVCRTKSRSAFLLRCCERWD